MSTTTYLPKAGELNAQWHVVDATDLILGRMAAKIAVILQGKHKPTYTAHIDTGDFVIVLNAEKIRVTGKKSESLEWDTYSRYASGRKVYSFNDMRGNHPEKLIELAIRRMLPKSRLGRKMLGKLKVYRGGEHEHAAQQPKELSFTF